MSGNGKHLGVSMRRMLLCLLFAIIPAFLSADVIILNNGRQIIAKSYRIQGDLVYITKQDGVVYSIKKDTVDLDLTTRINLELARKRGSKGSEDDSQWRESIVELAEKLKAKKDEIEAKNPQSGKIASRMPRQKPEIFGEEKTDDLGIPEIVYPEGEGPDKPFNLYPTMDLYVDEYRNRALDEQELRLCGTLKHNRRIFIKFDYKHLQNIELKEASLRFYVFEPLQTPGKMYVKTASPASNWSTKSFDKYKDAPEINREGFGVIVTEKKGWYDVSVSEIIKSQLESGKNYGIMLYTTQNAFIRIYSRESPAADKRPYLAINFRKPQPPYVPLASGSFDEEPTPKTLITQIIKRSSLLFSAIVSFVPAIAVFFATSRRLKKKYAFLLSVGILIATFLSVFLALKFSP